MPSNCTDFTEKYYNETNITQDMNTTFYNITQDMNTTFYNITQDMNTTFYNISFSKLLRRPYFDLNGGIDQIEKKFVKID